MAPSNTKRPGRPPRQALSTGYTPGAKARLTARSAAKDSSGLKDHVDGANIIFRAPLALGDWLRRALNVRRENKRNVATDDLAGLLVTQKDFLNLVLSLHLEQNYPDLKPDYYDPTTIYVGKQDPPGK